MLNAVLIANAGSGAGRKLRGVDLPGHWIRNPACVAAGDVARADLLALLGGDGTVQKTLSQLLAVLPADALPPIAVLPFGTTNMSAGNLNRVRGHREAVKSLDRIVRGGSFECQRRSLLRVQDGPASHYGLFFGMGVIADVVAQWNRERGEGAAVNRLRTLRAMAGGLRKISSARPICLNGAAHSVYGLLATTLDRLLFGSTPFWGEGRRGDLRLTWVGADARHLLRHAPGLLRGSPRMARLPGYFSQAGDAVTLEFEGPFILDGEIFSAPGRPLTIERTEPLNWIRL